MRPCVTQTMSLPMNIDALWAPFVEFDFMRRALWGSWALALGAGPVGVFLMLRRMSLMGDAMAHAVLPGAALGYWMSGLSLGAMTVGGAVAGLLVAIGSGVVARFTVLKEDTSLAAFYLISLALGVLLVSAGGNQVDLLNVLFGTVLGLNDDALTLLWVFAGTTLLGLALLYRPLVLECVDPVFLRSVSRWSAWAHHGFLVLVVLNLVSGFHALGTLMAVGMMVLPAASARFWWRGLVPMLLGAALIAGTCATVGLWLSYQTDWATSPTIVLCMALVYAISMWLGPYGAWRSNHASHTHLKG